MQITVGGRKRGNPASAESRKKKNADRRYVKWLGVIFDDSLDFDMHWKARLAKARKALGSLSGVGASQCGMCPGGWKKAYEGMIRSIATWRTELGWRVQKAWEKEFSRLQTRLSGRRRELAGYRNGQSQPDGGCRRCDNTPRQQPSSVRGSVRGGPH